MLCVQSRLWFLPEKYQKPVLKCHDPPSAPECIALPPSESLGTCIGDCETAGGLGGFGVCVGLEQKLVSAWTHMGGLGWVALGGLGWN